MAAAAPPKKLTLEEARTAIDEVIAAFDDAENAQKLEDARAQCAGDLQKMMATMIPLAIAIQKPVIEKFGFPGTQPGAMQFMVALQAHAAADAEMAQKTASLRSRWMPTAAK